MSRSPLSPVAIDRAFGELCDRLPPSVRAAAIDLPHRVGIATPDRLWSNYATLPPVVDLPFFVAGNASEADLTRARRAHWYAGFVGLCLDRIADAQSPEVTRPLLDALKRAWIDALAELSTTPAAEDAVESALVRARAAFAVEKRARAGRVLTHADYVTMTRDKTTWFGLASAALAARSGATESFEPLFDALMLGLQTYDDAIDEAEDVAEQGIGVPEMLGLGAAGLLVASTESMRRASTLADDASWSALAEWLRDRAESTARVAQATPIDVLGGALLLEAHAFTRPPRRAASAR